MKSFLISHEFAQALGITLLHSLWQIILVYIFFRLMMFALRRSSSKYRYGISLTCYFIIPLIMFLTFLQYYNAETSQSASFYFSSGEVIPTDYINNKSFAEEKISSLNRNDFLPWFVYIYITGVIILSTRLMFSLLFLSRFRRNDSFSPPAYLEKKLNILKDKFNIHKKIRILESGLAKVPFVFGYLKPVIIVPAGLLTHLPYNQIEAILLHELAHIKRKDYLINIIQSVVEILLFYHPLVYMISKRIRFERESCCDDLALRHCDNHLHYAKALASMEEVKIDFPYASVAFAEKDSLLLRIKRILKPETMKTKSNDRLLAGIIILAGLMVILISGAAGIHKLKSSPATGIDVNSTTSSINLSVKNHSATMQDTIFRVNKNKIIATIKNNGDENRYEMFFKNGELTELYLNGEKVPPSEFPEYSGLTKSALSEIENMDRSVAKEERATIDEEKIKKEIAEARKQLEEIEWDTIRKELEKFRSEEEMARIRAEIERAKVEIRAINIDSIKAEVERAIAEIDTEKIRAENKKALEEARRAMEDIDYEEIKRNIESIDWDEIEKSIRESMTNAKKEMENIDWQAIEKNIEQSLREAEIQLRQLEEKINKQDE